MRGNSIHVVTGAFGYLGKYIAHQLLAEGYHVGTLTNSLHRNNPFEGQIEVHPFHFDDQDKLRDSLQNVDVLYNTYWVRFNHKRFKHSIAVENTLKLFRAAQKAGVKRIVHVSITNPSIDSRLEYFSGKAKLEKALKQLGLSYAILRPAVLFGKEDILINNIAWMIRHLPTFGIFGKGEYRLQPIFVEDMAKLAVEWASNDKNVIIDAIGPETYSYRDLVLTIMEILGKKRMITHINPGLGYWCGRLLGAFVGDVVITREEIDGLMSDLLCTESKPTGITLFSEWAKNNKEDLGVRYANELKRR